MTEPRYLSSDEIRDRFSRAMSAMYQAEVPQYTTLLELVDRVNRETLERDPALARRLAAQGELERLGIERHGAIRVGTAGELAMLRRLFAVMGMQPVGYYDLSRAGVPVHATAFRPIADGALARNPFRIFTSLLRLELIESEALRQRATAILTRRDIFTDGCRDSIARHEAQGGLTEAQAERFVAEVLETFRAPGDGCLGYLVVDETSRTALAIDPRLDQNVEDVLFKLELFERHAKGSGRNFGTGSCNFLFFGARSIFFDLNGPAFYAVHELRQHCVFFWRDWTILRLLGQHLFHTRNGFHRGRQERSQLSIALQFANCITGSLRQRFDVNAPASQLGSETGILSIAANRETQLILLHHNGSCAVPIGFGNIHTGHARRANGF